MNPFDILKLLNFLYKFSKGAATFTKIDEPGLEELTSEQISDFRSHAQRIIRICIICLIIGAVVLPLTVPWYTYFKRNIKASDAVERMLCGVVLTPILAPASLFLGASIGCLFAPEKFMRSPIGDKWLKLVGAQSILASRIICTVLALVLIGFFAGYCWFIYSMHPR